MSAIAIDDACSAFVNSQASGNVLTNDSVISPELEIVSGPSHGSVTLLSNGDFAYTPDAGFSGIDTFEYQLREGYMGDGSTDQATVTIEILNYPTPQYSGSVNIETAYRNEFGVGNGSLIAIEGGTFTYATGVPFRVSGHVDDLPNTPLNAPAQLHVWSADQSAPGAIDLYFEVAPGTSFDELIAAPIGDASVVSLHAELLNPYTSAGFVSDQCDEPIVDFDMMLKDLLSSLDPQAINDGLGQGSDEIVDSMAQSRFTPEVIADYELQHDLTTEEVTARIEQLKDLAKAKMRELAGSAIDELFGSEEPHWIVRVGANDPGKGAAEGFWGAIQDALVAGVAEVKNGRDWADAVGDFVDINWGDAGGLFNDPAVESAIHQLLETGNTGDLGDVLESTIVIDPLTVHTPSLFPDDSEFNGALSVSLTGISFDRIRGMQFGASFSIDRDTQFGVFRVDSFQLGVSQSYNLLEEEWDTPTPFINVHLDW